MKRIKEGTQQQSGFQESLVVRKTRIAASKCKRKIQRPTTSPTKAMIHIFHLKDNFQSQQIQQVLEDEKKVVTMYKEILGVKSINRE